MGDKKLNYFIFHIKMSIKDDNISVYEHGIQYENGKRVKQHHPRMTKQELHNFVKWMIAQTDDNMRYYSNQKIANIYEQQTGKYINRETVRRNRDCWIVYDNKIMRVDEKREYDSGIKLLC